MKKKFKNTLTRISAVLLLVAMVFIPIIDVKAEGEIVIDVATVDITTPVAGEHPSFQETVGDSSKYYIDVDHTKWVQQFSPYNYVWDDYTFEAGKIYSYRVLFRPKSGYKFSDDTLFLINGKKTGQWGDDKAMAYQYFYVVDQETDVNIDFRYKDENDVYVTFSQTSIKLNSTVNPPATNPTKNGFTFVKWTTANGYDVDFNDAINSNRDYFAKFVSNENLQTHTITLNPNNGTDESDSINNIVSGSINKLGTLDSYGFTIPVGKQFYGWKVGEEVYLPGEYFEVTSNLMAVAQYIGSTVPTTSQVTFNLNGGTMTGTNPQVVNNGENATKPATNPTYDGHVFAGWYADAGLNIPFDFTNTTINSDTTIYAKWDIAIKTASATVTAPINGEHPDFNPVSGDSSLYTVIANTWYLHETPYPTLTAESVYETGKGYSFRLTFTPKAGYQFTDDTTFTVNGISTAKYGSIGDREYYAVASSPLTHKVSFDKNGGTGTMADVTGLSGTYTLPANGFTAPTNKQFKGWSLTSDGTIITTLEMTEDKTVYAIWEDIPVGTYTILEGNNQTYTKGSNTDIVIKASGDLAKINSIEIDGGNVIDPANYELTSGSTILTLKSSFLENSSIGQHTITIKYNDGEVDATLTVAETSNNNNNNNNNDNNNNGNTNTNTNINDNTNTNTNNNNTNNPQTSYDVVTYIYSLIFGIICFAGGSIYLKRKKLFGNK